MENAQSDDGVTGRRRMNGLASNLTLFVMTPLVVNGVIFGLGVERGGGAQTGLPPGWVVGSIWLLLFAAMGATRWLLLRSARTHGEQLRAEWVSALAFLCLLYPVYTRGFSDLVAGLEGNVVTGLLAVPVMVYTFRKSTMAGWLLVPLVVWLSYAAWVTAKLVYR